MQFQGFTHPLIDNSCYVDTDHGIEFLPAISRLLYQMSQQGPNHSPMHEGNDDTIPGRLLRDVIKTLAERSEADGNGGNEEMQKVESLGAR